MSNFWEYSSHQFTYKTYTIKYDIYFSVLVRVLIFNDKNERIREEAISVLLLYDNNHRALKEELGRLLDGIKDSKAMLEKMMEEVFAWFAKNDVIQRMI